MQYTVFIVDDEEQGRAALVAVLNKYCSFVQIAGEAKNTQDAIEGINTLKPDIVLLDINLGDGTGFDVLKKCIILPKTIFVTAYSDFALKAIKVSAVDYVLKPFESSEIIEALKKATKQLQGEKFSSLPEQTAVSNGLDKPERIVLPSSNGYDVLNLNDINYLASDNNYTIFYLINNSKKVVSKTLKHFEELLSSSGFFRCHQKYLVNLNHIVKYHKVEEGTLLMKNNLSVDVSRRKKEALIVLMREKFLK